MNDFEPIEPTTNDVQNIECLSQKSIAVCKNNRLTTLYEIVQFYIDNGSFATIVAGDESLNTELCIMARTYIDSILMSDYFDERSKTNDNDDVHSIKPQNNDNQLANSQHELQQTFQSLTIKHHIILTLLLRTKYASLSVRANSAINTVLTKPLTFTHYFETIIDTHNFNFKSIENVGFFTATTMEECHSEILLLFNQIAQIRTKHELNKLYLQAILKSHFAIKQQHPVLFDIETFGGTIPVFALLAYLIDNGYIFNDTNTLIFKTVFNYYNNYTYKPSTTFYKDIDRMPERVRQIRIKILHELPTKLSFLTKFSYAMINKYEIDFKANIIEISEDVYNNIKQHEGVTFNTLFIHKVYSILYAGRLTLIGNEYNLIFRRKYNDSHSWQSSHLVQKQLSSCFDFTKFIEDIHDLTQVKRGKEFEFDLQKHILTKTLQTDTSELNEAILQVCKRLVSLEFPALCITQNCTITFPVNRLVYIIDAIIDILQESQKPMTKHELFDILRTKQHNTITAPANVPDCIHRDIHKRVIIMGTSHSYGLREWAINNRYSKPDNIRTLVENFLKQHDKPQHIKEITKQVNLFRKTTVKNIWQNIKLDFSDRFKFYNNSFIGLKDMHYEESSEIVECEPYVMTSENIDISIRLLQQFVATHTRFPRSGRKEEKYLYSKIIRLRQAYINNNLTVLQIEQLRTINFVFSNTHKPIDWFNRLLLFHQTHNRYPLCIKKESAIYIHCINVRKQYRLKQLSETQIEQLRACNFDFKRSNYQLRMDDLYQFIKTHNRLPSYRNNNEKSLYNFWLKKNTTLKKNKLSENQANEIKAIKVAFSVKQIYGQNTHDFALLKTFILKHGRSPLPSDKKEQNLINLTNKLRVQYCNNELTTSNIKQLHALDFDFEPTQNPEQLFNSKILLLQQFVETNERYPLANFNPENYLAQFCKTIHQDRANKKLSQSQIASLQAINFPFETEFDQQPINSENFALLKTFLKSYKTNPSKNNCDNQQLITYCKQLKYKYHNNELSYTLIKQLQAIHFSFENRFSAIAHFNKNYEFLQQFVQSKARFPKAQSKGEHYIYQIYADIQQNYKQGLYSKVQIHQLRAIQFNFEQQYSKRKQETTQLDTLKLFVAKHNRYPLCSDFDNKSLYTFCCQLRNKYKKNKLAHELIQQLQEINFNFEHKYNKHKQETTQLDTLKLFIAQHNRYPMYSDFDNKSLYTFCCQLRGKYRKNELSFELIQQLQEINFYFDYKYFKPDHYTIQLEKLKLFIAQHNRYPMYSDFDNKSLYTFCCQLRGKYRKNELSFELIQQLQEINFDFNYKYFKPDHYTIQLEKLKLFIAQHDRYPMYSDFDNKSQYNFCCQLRSKYRKNELADTRIQQLQEMDFQFTLSPLSQTTPR